MLGSYREALGAERWNSTDGRSSGALWRIGSVIVAPLVGRSCISVPLTDNSRTNTVKILKSLIFTNYVKMALGVM